MLINLSIEFCFASCQLVLSSAYLQETRIYEGSIQKGYINSNNCWPPASNYIKSFTFNIETDVVVAVREIYLCSENYSYQPKMECRIFFLLVTIVLILKIDRTLSRKAKYWIGIYPNDEMYYVDDSINPWTSSQYFSFQPSYTSQGTDLNSN